MQRGGWCGTVALGFYGARDLVRAPVEKDGWVDVELKWGLVKGLHSQVQRNPGAWDQAGAHMWEPQPDGPICPSVQPPASGPGPPELPQP